MPRSELSQRVVSGLILASFSLIYIFYASELPFVLIACFIGLIGTYEFGRAGIGRGLPLHQAGLYLNHLLSFSALWFYFYGDEQQSKLFIYALLGSILAGPVLAKGKFISGVIWQLVALIWVTLPIYIITLLRFEDERGSLLILFVILTAAFNDIFAYFGGKKFGKHKLAAAISPNKTIEGSLFGYLGGLMVGILMGGYYLELFPWPTLILVTLILVFSAQVGDLIESKFKRYCGIKDTGNILPGHGGILDRFDAYLTSLPTFWLILHFF